MSVLSQKIIGLYLEKERLQYTCVKKGMFGLHPAKPGSGMESAGMLAGEEIFSLRRFLENISARTKLDIFLALPRGSFFARDMSLPPMLLEEAWDSVQNNLAVSCHLPLDEIYYDVHLSTSEDGRINALIFYAARRDIDRILNVFEETGRRHLLKRVFPFSFGVYRWLRMQGYALPLTLILPSQEGFHELAVYGVKGFLYSTAWPISEGLEVGRAKVAGAGKPIQKGAGQVYLLKKEGIADFPAPKNRKFDRLPFMTDNRSIAAIAGGLSNKQRLSLEGTPTRVKQFRPWQILFPLCVIVLLVLGYVSWRSFQDFSVRVEQVNALKTEIQKLQDKVKPLENKLEALQKSRQFLNDIRTYVVAKPELYRALNEIAILLPEGTWFYQFLYEREKVTLRGTSKDALQVLKLLRESNRFQQVKLLGSVSRDRQGNERFTITLELKKGMGETNPRP